MTLVSKEVGKRQLGSLNHRVLAVISAASGCVITTPMTLKRQTVMYLICARFTELLLGIQEPGH